VSGSPSILLRRQPAQVGLAQIAAELGQAGRDVLVADNHSLRKVEPHRREVPDRHHPGPGQAGRDRLRRLGRHREDRRGPVRSRAASCRQRRPARRDLSRRPTPAGPRPFLGELPEDRLSLFGMERDIIVRALAEHGGDKSDRSLAAVPNAIS